MRLYTLSLSLFLSVSPLLSSDYLTIEQQNEEMNRAFKGEKPLPLTNTEIINALKELGIMDNSSPQILEQIFPGHSHTIPTEKGFIALDQYEQIKKHAAEIMFHRLNDALNFVLTNRELLLSAILKYPKLIFLTSYTVAHGEDGELCFDFPLSSAPHPVAHLAQGYLILKEYQYWIDVLLLFKNTVFSQHTLSSYDHNAACGVKDLIQNQIRLLQEKIDAHSTISVSLSQLIDQTNNHDFSFFVNINHNFSDLLKDCLKSIDEALPRGAITQVNISTAAAHLKNKEHMVDLGKNKRELVFEKLSPQIHKLHLYFSGNYTTILRGVRSMAIMEYITTNFTPEERDTAM